MTSKKGKTKDQLIREVGTLQQRVAGLEEELRRSEELFRSLMEHAADAFVIHDLEGNIVYVSQTTCDLLGFAGEELVGMSAWDIVEGMPVGGARVWGEMVPGVSITDCSRWRCKDGSTFPVEVHLRTFELRGRWLIFALGRDVTERQEAENALRESEQRFRALMEHSADAFFIHDLKGRIVDVNQMACESLGYSRDELLDLCISDIYPLSPRDGASEWQSMVPGVPVTIMAYHRRKDGTNFPAEVSISTFDLHEDRFVLGVARDVTQRQAAETAQRELAVLEERNRLARELHDSVTQALYSASLMSEAGRRLAEAGDLERVKRYLGRLGESCQQALKEMRLLVYQLRPSVLEQEGLVGALRQRMDAVEKRAGVEARLILNEVLDVPADWEEELYWISQEALNNALKHGGATAVTVRINAGPGNVDLEVEDNGKGFDPDAVMDKGGLGLTSMRERAESISAIITVSSTPGKGTKIKVTVGSGAEQEPLAQGAGK